jgi:hypothetical protein
MSAYRLVRAKTANLPPLSRPLQGRDTSVPLQENLRGIGCNKYCANKPLVPTRNGEAPLLAAQRRR